MSMTRTLTIAAAALALLALPTIGGAQTTPQTAPRLGQGAVSYGADAGEATPNSLSLRGRAEVVQGQNRLRADVISGSGVNSEIDRIEAKLGDALADCRRHLRQQRRRDEALRRIDHAMVRAALVHAKAAVSCHPLQPRAVPE